MNLHSFQVWRSILWPGLALLFLLPGGFGQTIRVTTWNWQPATVAATAGGTPASDETRLRDAAAILQKLAPDVILLQQVRDWKLCGQLAQALKPAEYNVVVCSAFRDPLDGALAQQQVAILSRQRAYFAWSESWRTPDELSPGGFAFAAIQIGSRRLGFWSVSAADPSVHAGPQAGAASIGQLLAQVGSVRNWEANQVQVFVIAGTFDTHSADSPRPEQNAFRLLGQAGFADVFQAEPTLQRTTLPRKAAPPGATDDFIFTQPPDAAANPRIISTEIPGLHPVTCDLELDPAAITARRAARIEPAPSAEPPRPSQAKAPPPVAKPAPELSALNSALNSALIGVGVLAGIAILVGTVWVLARRTRARSRAAPRSIAASVESGPSPASLYTVVVATRSATGSASEPAGATLQPRPVARLESPGTTRTHSEVLQSRALAAEQRAEHLTTAIRAGVISQLSRWLKQKLVRKLITDRAQLLETQQAAALKATAVEERLARIESQIQQQNQAYQHRIDDLTRQLIAAKEEHRDLIRAQIVRVKAEMEAARARLLAPTKGENQE